MPNATLDRLLEEIRRLPAQDLQELRRRLDEEADSETACERLFLEDLLNAGLLSEIKPRCTAPEPPRRRIDVPGKPLSESIIEDRI